MSLLRLAKRALMRKGSLSLRRTQLECHDVVSYPKERKLVPFFISDCKQNPSLSTRGTGTYDCVVHPNRLHK